MKQDQNYPFRRLLLNQSGQAVVEYILLLVIIVSLVIGAKNAFGKVDDFISHYIGDYVTCLMEYGELPSLGVSDANQKKHLDGTGKKCDEDFAGFTFEDGRPSTGGGGPGGGGPGGSGSGKGNTGNKSNSASGAGGGKNSSSTAAKGGKGGGENSDGGSGSSDGSGSGKNGSSKKPQAQYASGAIQRNAGNSTSDAYDNGNGKVRVLEEDEEAKKRKKNQGFGYARGSRGGYGNDKYRAITGTMQAEMEKTIPRKPRAPATSVSRLKGDDGNRFGPYTKTFVPPAVKQVQVKDSDNSAFSFGYFIRWLIIGAMILAIIVFFGGQIMNYSNSKD